MIVTSSERQQFNELRRELKRVQMERDFKEKAAAFFAMDSSSPMS
jgi:transposase